MKKMLLLALLLVLFSCKSEYEERLLQAKVLKAEMDKISAMQLSTESPKLDRELQAIHREIIFLSKVSGNEEKFLQEIYSN